MSIKGMFKTLRITKEEGYLSLRELRLACLFVFPWKGRVELGLKGWIEGYQAEMQVGLGTDFRGHEQRHVLVEGRWGKLQSPLPNVGSFLHTQQPPNSSSGSCSSGRLWHHLLRDGISRLGLRALSAPITVQCYLSSCPNSYNSEVSTALSLGLINLLEWLRELRKIFYLPTRCHPDGRAAWGGVVEELRAHHSPGHDCLHQPGCLLRPLVLGFYGGFLTEAWLVKTPGNRVNLQPLLPPWKCRGWDWDFQSSNHRAVSPGNQPYPQLISKNHLIKVTSGVVCSDYRDTFIVRIT